MLKNNLLSKIILLFVAFSTMNIYATEIADVQNLAVLKKNMGIAKERFGRASEESFLAKQELEALNETLKGELSKSIQDQRPSEIKLCEYRIEHARKKHAALLEAMYESDRQLKS